MKFKRKGLAILALFTFALVFSIGQAAQIVYITPDGVGVDFDISNSLQNEGHMVTHHYESDTVNYNSFDVIILKSPILDSNINKVPINNKPTLIYNSGRHAIVHAFWTNSAGSQCTDNVYINYINNIPHQISEFTGGGNLGITSLAGCIDVYVINGPTYPTDYFGTPVASKWTYGFQQDAIVAIESGDTLTDGSTANARGVFFGLTEPEKWNSDAKTLFLNSINWLTEGTPTPECTDGETRCDPANPDYLQKCDGGSWKFEEVCVNGCSAGACEADIGTEKEFEITLVSTKPLDEDKSDGKLTYLYGNYALIDPTGEFVVESPIYQIHSEVYNPKLKYSTSKVGYYLFAATITYGELTWNHATDQWEITDSGKVISDTQSFKVDYPDPDINILDELKARLQTLLLQFLQWLTDLYNSLIT